MSNKLMYKILTKKDKNGVEYHEGVITLPGLKPTKLVKADGTSQFTTRATVGNAARNVAKRLNLEAQVEEGKTPVKKAAKKATTKRSKEQPAVTTPWSADS
jgi:hypothetical protein